MVSKVAGRYRQHPEFQSFYFPSKGRDKPVFGTLQPQLKLRSSRKGILMVTITCAEQYHLLRGYMMDHDEAGTILAATD